MTRHAYTVEGWGVGELWEADGRVVVAHEPPTPAPAMPGSAAVTPPRGTPGVPTETLSETLSRDGDGFVPELLQRIHSFFAGQREEFADIAIDLGECTPFQHDVVDTLRRIPWGEVASYGEVAALAGYPRAGRAVGNICAHNPCFLLIPCHRVVGANGIGSYGSLGVSYKRRLLRLEGNAAL